jgi:hypothetical protein
LELRGWTWEIHVGIYYAADFGVFSSVINVSSYQS